MGRNGAFPYHLLQRLPVVPANQYQGERTDFACLDQRERFKKFIHCPGPTRHHHKGIGVFEQQDLPHKKVPEVSADVQIGIGLLFVGQLNIAAY